MIILAIDTSCDETSVAITEDYKVIANIFWSKLKTHEKWGGVVPSEAKRQHMEFLEPAIKEAMLEAGKDWSDIDAIAATYGPGLAIALEAGLNKAKELAKEKNKKLIAVNHMIGHIYANLARDEANESYSGLNDFEFPLLALTISGGHTDLYLMEDHLKFKHIGETLDDAIGEAFDKVGRMLGMGYPAGPKLELAAKKGNPERYKLPRPLSNSGDYNWSYSGLKTAVLYALRKEIGDYQSKPGKRTYRIEDSSDKLSNNVINDMSASFQKAAIDSLVNKLVDATKEYKPKMFIAGGGVMANVSLRNELISRIENEGTKVYFPKPLWLCTDNAAMIAIAAEFYAENRWFVQDIDKLDRVPNLMIMDTL